VAEAQQKTILIVDDDPMNREVMEAFLESAGYQVRLANNGKRGLDAAREYSPHLIILDVKMPDMDGYEVCAILKANDATKHIPVLIVTGFKSREYLDKSQEAGADGFISRPFVGDRFIEYAHQLINKAPQQ